MKVESANIIPTLRFPGYSSHAETHELGKITKVIDCKHRTPEYVEQGIPIVSPGSIRWGEIDLVSPTKRVTDEDHESLMDHCQPRVGDLVLSRNQSLGIASHITSNEKFALGQDTVLIQQKDENGKLVFYRLQTSGTQNLISRLSGGSTFSRINLKDIRLLPLVLPTEESEQRKIANFLTAVDGRIGQLIQKKALLDDYKKGVMQQLFTQAIRFKDDHGNDFPDWVEKKLGELLTFKNGFNAEKSQYGTGVKFINVLDVLRPRPIAHDDIVGRVEIPAKDFPKFEVKYGDILFQRSSETREEVGQANVYVDRNHSAGFGGFLIRGQPKAKLEPLFMNYLLRTPIARNEITSKSGGSTRYNVSQETLSEAKITLPSSPREQTKIAEFLSAIDSKIESVATQITETQTFKRGLLQQMFV
jgi:type I restriction enzyme S subunit